MSVILITGAANAEAYRLGKILDGYDIVFGDHQELFKFSQKHTFVRIPKGDSPSFSHELLTLCLDLHIEKVFPLLKEEIVSLSESQILFEEFGIDVVIPSNEWLMDNLQRDILNSSSPIVILKNGNILAGSLSKTSVLTESLTGIFCSTFENNGLELTLFTANNANIR